MFVDNQRLQRRTLYLHIIITQGCVCEILIEALLHAWKHRHWPQTFPGGALDCQNEIEIKLRNIV